MLASTCINFGFGLKIDAQKNQKTRTIWLAIGVAINLSIIIYFKYVAFILGNINVLLTALHIDPIRSPHPALPAGISFYTFHALSYLIDVYRRHIKAQKDLIKLGLYISFFPKLIAGPIVRYEYIAPEISARTATLDGFSYGAQRFIIGLSKKLLLANTFAPFVDAIFSTPVSDLSVGIAWLGAVLYAFQIYFDFSGYSDMAIGLARIFGLHFKENFDYPYISQSITEFWRRWHISLSSWFKDYLYIPLGGNRVSTARNYFNLFTVFLLCGLWHGASWNFVLWGLWHGGLLVIEKDFLLKKLEEWPASIRYVYTWVMLLISWVLFRSDDLPHAVAYLQTMFGLHNGPDHWHPLASIITVEFCLALGLAVIGSTPLLQRILRGPMHQESTLRTMSFGTATIYGVSLFILLLLCYSALAIATFNPFIYFRF